MPIKWHQDNECVTERIFYDKHGRRTGMIKGIIRDNVIISGDLISYNTHNRSYAHRETGTFHNSILQGKGSCEFYDERGRRIEREEGFFDKGKLFMGVRIFYRNDREYRAEVVECL